MNFVTDILPLKNRLFRLALRIVSDHQEAEDIVQETMLKVWSKRDMWDTINSMEAYCMTVCRNIALDNARSRKTPSLSLDDIPYEATDESEDVLQRMQRQERLDHIRRLMNSLPEKQRTCMQLRDFEGLTYKEIAHIMDITEDQVKISIFRARKALKEFFERKKAQNL